MARGVSGLTYVFRVKTIHALTSRRFGPGGARTDIQSLAMETLGDPGPSIGALSASPSAAAATPMPAPAPVPIASRDACGGLDARALTCR